MSMLSESGMGQARGVDQRTGTGRLKGPVAKARARRQQVAREPNSARDRQPKLVVLCASSPDSPIVERATREAAALAQQGFDVRYYVREAPATPVPGVKVRVTPVDAGPDLVAIARDFASRARSELEHELDRRDEVHLLAHEWQAIPAMLALPADVTARRVLSLHSLETQRADMSTRGSLEIKRIEHEGLAAADAIIVRDDQTAEHAQNLVPAARKRLHYAREPFPVTEFDSKLDPGEVKARYAIGPTDPTVLYIGDMNHAHGPDLLIKAVPPVLRNHPQARVIFVGDGDLLWPVRVQSRYMLLDYAVRVVGHVGGAELRELVAASDIVVVPSRTRTEDWEILAGWAARRPVVATHEVAALVYPNFGSLVWGIERVMYDPELGRRIGAAGYARLCQERGWHGVGAHLKAVLRPEPAAARQQTNPA
jgi:glycosyltransferase involved in cell wall biosynthesis